MANADEALDRRCDAHTAAHRHLKGVAGIAAGHAFDDLAGGQVPIEEMADTLTGVQAQARACQNAPRT